MFIQEFIGVLLGVAIVAAVYGLFHLFTLLKERGLARLARKDVNTFAEYVFGIKQGTLHRDLQERLSRKEKVLVAIPRAHGKNTQLAVRLLWELGHAPGLRIKVVVGEDLSLLDYIESLLTNNPRLRRVFPHLILTARKADSLTVKRSSVSTHDPSLQVCRVDAPSTGGRADILVFNDVCTYQNSQTEASRYKVLMDVRLGWLPLRSNNGGRLWWFCTPQNKDDANHVLRVERVFDAVIWEPAIDLIAGTALWPEGWSLDQLHETRTRIGSDAFKRQFLLEFN